MDYRSYHLTRKQFLQTLLMSLAAAALVAWLVYESFWALLAGPWLFFLLRRMRIKKELAIRKEVLLEQFWNMLRALSAALCAGYSIENAVKEAYQEMQLLCGKDSYICQELKTILQGLSVHVPIETLFLRFAERADCEEISEFAEIFAIARKSSGSIGQILERSSARISVRHNTRREIEVACAARKMEQRVMNGIPVLILFYLKVSDPEYMSVLYGNVFGVLFMTGCLAAYLGAMFLAQKMADIPW